MPGVSSEASSSCSHLQPVCWIVSMFASNNWRVLLYRRPIPHLGKAACESDFPRRETSYHLDGVVLVPCFSPIRSGTVQYSVAMDSMKTIEPPPKLHDELPVKLSATTGSPDAVHIASLHQEETPRVRTKLRLHLILTALYVSHSILL